MNDFRGFEEGLAGGGWRMKGAKTQQNFIAKTVSPRWRFPLKPFFEINPGILCSGIDNSERLIALNSN